METLDATEVCRLLKIDFDLLRQLRRRRDATAFPPPIMGEHGLAWHEADLAAWIGFVHEWQAAGGTREALEAIDKPTYLACEPEFRTKEQRTR